MSVVFGEEALADHDAITRSIGQRNPAAASPVIARIHRVIYGTINAFPLSGRLNRSNNTREYAVPGFALPCHLPAGHQSGRRDRDLSHFARSMHQTSALSRTRRAACDERPACVPTVLWHVAGDARIARV
jgi:plasmid stabilization system protein ParE